MCLCVSLLLLFIAHNENSSRYWLIFSPLARAYYRWQFRAAIRSISISYWKYWSWGETNTFTHTTNRNNLGPNLSRTRTIDSIVVVTLLLVICSVNKDTESESMEAIRCDLDSNFDDYFVRFVRFCLFIGYKFDFYLCFYGCCSDTISISWSLPIFSLFFFVWLRGVCARLLPL